MPEEQDYLEIAIMYLDKAPGWVLWILFGIFFILVLFLFREFMYWLFRDHKKFTLMEEQNELLNKINRNLFILTQRTVSSGFKKEDEKG